MDGSEIFKRECKEKKEYFNHAIRIADKALKMKVRYMLEPGCVRCI